MSTFETLTELLHRKEGSSRRISQNPALLSRAVLYIFLILSSIAMLAPFVYMVSVSLKPDYELQNISSLSFLRTINWRNYVTAWKRANFSQYAWNTVVYAVISTVGQVALGAVAGYSFARLKFRGKQSIIFVGTNNDDDPFQRAGALVCHDEALAISGWK